MRTLLCALIVSLSGITYGQYPKFETLNDSIFVIHCFHMDILKNHPLKHEFTTDYPDQIDQNLILVYERFTDNNEKPEYHGDPCLFVDRRKLESLDKITWLRVTELYLRKKWIYLTVTVIKKENEKTNEVYTFQYKVKSDRYNSSGGGVNGSNFKKIKDRRNSP